MALTSGTGIRVANYQRPVNLLEIANRGASGSVERAGRTSFKQMFSTELAQTRQVAFSKHAQERLFSRGINLTEETLNALADAIDKAEAKGSRETLVLSEEAGFVVSVPDRTVVTAFDKGNLREGVVTSIDSAVII